MSCMNDQYDDDPNPVDEALRFLDHLKGKNVTGNERWAMTIIEQLLWRWPKVEELDT